MAMTLRDMLTGMPDSPIQNIPLGFNTDPRYNKFQFNLLTTLGPGPGVDTGMSRLSDYQSGTMTLPGAPSPSGSAGAGGSMPAPSQAPPALPSPQLFAPGQSIMHQGNDQRSRTVFAPGESVMNPLKKAMTQWGGGLNW